MKLNNYIIEDISLEAARELARRFVGHARAHFGRRLKAAWLFGSAARGDWTPESDIDVLVLLDIVTPADSEWLVALAVKMGVCDSGIVLQPIFMTQDEFSRLTERERRFALDVHEEGMEL